jgi:hypothetical protein
VVAILTEKGVKNNNRALRAPIRAEAFGDPLRGGENAKAAAIRTRFFGSQKTDVNFP